MAKSVSNIIIFIIITIIIITIIIIIIVIIIIIIIIIIITVVIEKDVTPFLLDDSLLNISVSLLCSSFTCYDPNGLLIKC